MINCFGFYIYSIKKFAFSNSCKYFFCSTNINNNILNFLLKEKVGIYRWLAVLVGFVGIIFITEPGFSSLNLYYIYPIIFCLGLSYVAIAIRKLSSTEPVWLISFFFSFSIMLLSFLSFYQNWILPSIIF